MKTLLSTALFSAVVFTATGQAAGMKYHTLPSPVEVNRELPRTRTISYDSEQASIEGARGASRYLQPLREGDRAARQDGEAEVINRRFAMPFAWIDREVFVRIGQIDGAYEVAVNGKFAGYNQNGMVPAEFDATNLVVENNNEVQIKIYRDPAANALVKRDGKSAAIGESYVIAQPKVRIRDYVLSTGFEGGEAALQLGVILKTHLLNPKDVRLYYKLLSPSGEEVSGAYRDVEIGRKNEDTVSFFINVRNARAWNHETPNLYTLALKIQHEGRFTEYVAYKVGLRTAEMRDGRLLINSRETPYSVAEFTVRADSAQTAAELQKLKQGGYNMVKAAGYPQPEYFYDICDAIGLYVCDQADINTARWGASRAIDGNPSNDPVWREAYADRAATMYYSSRNHPSVVMFSIAEESANGYNLYEAYMDMKARESSRPIVYRAADGEWNSDAVPGALQESDPTVAGRIRFDIGHNDAVATELGVEFAMTDVPGRYTVRNNAQLADFHGELIYTVRQGTKKISRGSIPVMVPPQSSLDVTVPSEGAKPGKKLKYTVDLVNR